MAGVDLTNSSPGISSTRRPGTRNELFIELYSFMAKKKRVRIPDEVGSAVMFECDLTCCICRQPEKALQLHHLDSNPANNASDNLVALCLDHHNDASSKSTIGRGLDPGTIRRYRESWFDAVRARRAVSLARTDENQSSHQMMMEALACHEVRKITFGLDVGWKLVEERLEALAPYSDPWEYGVHLRAEILSPLYTLSGKTRHGMPTSVASRLGRLATSMLPMTSLVAPSNTSLSEGQVELFDIAIALGHAIAHDGVKYLRNLRVMSEGAHVLWTILRYARLNRLETMRAECLSQFEGLLAVADDVGDAKARQWLEFERADALALDGEPLPVYPAELAAEIRRPTAQ